MRESVGPVASNLGTLLTLFAFLVLTSAAAAVLWGEWDAVPGEPKAKAARTPDGAPQPSSIDVRPGHRYGH